MCVIPPSKSTQLIITVNYRHRVLVDKWVNSQELQQLEEAGLLGWQDDDHEPSQRIEQDRGDQRPPRQLEEPEELQSVTSGPPAPGQMRLSLQEQVSGVVA